MPEPKGLNFGAPVASAPAVSPTIQPMQPATAPTGQALVPFTLQEISTYGQETAMRAASAAQKINAATRGGDIDQMGKLLGQLLTAGAQYDPDKLKAGGIFGFFKKKKRELEAHYKTVDQQVNTIAVDVQKEIDHFFGRIGDIEQLAVENQQRHADLGKVIEMAVARIAWMEANPPAADAADPFSAQAVQDWNNRIEHAKKKVDDLRRIQTMCELDGPMMAMMKENSALLVEKFSTIRTLTLPQMQQKFALYIINMEAEKGAEYANQIDDMNNRLIEENAKKLGVATVKVRQSVSRSSIDMATLQTVKAEFDKTLDEVKRIADQTQQRLATERPQYEAISQQLAQRLAGQNQAA